MNTLMTPSKNFGLGEVIRIPRPSNFHAHLRADTMLEAVAPYLMRYWKHLLVMPNTGPIDTVSKMIEYRDRLMRIRDMLGYDVAFIMTLYLTEALTPEIIARLPILGFPCAVKYYPPNATTGSEYGIPLKKADTILRAMAVHGVRLLGHFETVMDNEGNEIPHERREDYFMEYEYAPVRAIGDLKITIEHVTTRSAIHRVLDDRTGNTTCTITPQAMILVREDLDSLTWGNHGKCMPIAKTERDVDAVRAFALSGDSRAYLGDDTAPHPASKKVGTLKDAASGCFFPNPLGFYMNIFTRFGQLHNLENFACFNGPRAWGLPEPKVDEFVTLVRTDDDLYGPVAIPGMDDHVVPFGGTGHDALHCGWVVRD